MQARTLLLLFCCFLLLCLLLPLQHSARAACSGCNGCHGNPPSVSTLGGPYGLAGVGSTPGAHLVHTGGQSFGSNENTICYKCHYDGMFAPNSASTTLSCQDSKLTLGFNINGHDGTGCKYDGSVSLNGTWGYRPTNNTTITQLGTMTCSNIYCHSNATGGTNNSGTLLPSLPSDPRPVAAGTSPAWNGYPGDTNGIPSIGCNLCHGNTTYSGWQAAAPLYAQDSPKSNSHSKHVIGYNITCNYCHYATTTDGVTITNPANHANGVYDVVPGSFSFQGIMVNFNYTYDPGGGQCSNISCHTGIPSTKIWGNTTLQGVSGSAASDNYVCNQVNFTASPSPAQGATSYYWQFGDGGTSTAQNPAHIYSAPGTYYANLFVRGANYHIGQQYSISAPALASVPSNLPVVAAFSLAVNNPAVTLTDLSYDPNYNYCGHSGPGSITITWGDGTIETHPITLTNNPSNQQYTHSYTRSGTYTVSTVVTNNVGQQTSSSPSSPFTIGNVFTISGSITHTGGSGYYTGQPFVSCTLYLYNQSGTPLTTTQTDSNGNYSFKVDPYGPGTYYVRPYVVGFTFSPSISSGYSSSATNVNFTATP